MEDLFSQKNIKTSMNPLGPKTLILDLDETLVHSWENPKFVEDYKIYTNKNIYNKFHPVGLPSSVYSITYTFNERAGNVWGLFRPHTEEFIKFAHKYFDNVLIWSAGIQFYVEEIIKQMYSQYKVPFPKLIYARDKCVIDDGKFHKPINTLITDLSSKPYTTLNIDPKNTLIIDDKNHTFLRNTSNGILIPEYIPGKDSLYKIPTLEDLLDKSDNYLVKLIDWLNKPHVRNSEDVRLLDKTSIFY